MSEISQRTITTKVFFIFQINISHYVIYVTTFNLNWNCILNWPLTPISYVKSWQELVVCMIMTFLFIDLNLEY